MDGWVYEFAAPGARHAHVVGGAVEGLAYGGMVGPYAALALLEVGAIAVGFALEDGAAGMPGCLVLAGVVRGVQQHDRVAARMTCAAVDLV